MAPKRAPIIRLTSLAATCVFVVASLIAGCMSMAPDYRQPTAPIAGEYPADAPRTESSLSGAIEWRSVFADTELQGIIELALENSRDLRAAVLRVQEARALRGIQRADRFPNVGALNTA
jgi:multidrug efflux system outer membrane protein